MENFGLQVINDRVVTSSRNVAEMFEKQHLHILRDIRNLECSKEFSQSNFGLSSETVAMPNGGTRQQPVYLLTRDGFTLLTMGFTGEKAAKFKEAYIKAFNEMEARLKHGAFMTPQMIEEVLFNPDLIIGLAQNLKDEQTRRKELQSKVEADAPKVLFADAVATSHSDINVGDLAKLICQNGCDIGQNRLYNWLRENGYIMKEGTSSSNMPTQRALEMKLFRVKETAVTTSDGTIIVKKTPKVTPRGQQYFINKFLNTGLWVA